MMRLVARGAALSCTLAFAAFGAGCTGDERVAPVGAGGGDATSSANSTSVVSSSASGSSGSGPVLRTVFQRNPFGAQVGNLLADGDFELSFGFAGQQGWTSFGNQGQERLIAETGGLCRSGLRCARVAPGLVMFARGTTAPDGADMQATLWAKPATTPDCTGISAYAILCDSFAQNEKLIRSETPDADGWCTYSVLVKGGPVATCLYVENQSDQEMIFDDASLVALPPDAPSRRIAVPIEPAPPETRARMDRVRDLIRNTLPLGASRPLPTDDGP